MLTLVIYTFYVIFFGSQLFTGIYLLVRLTKIKQSNLLALVLFFLLNPLEIIFILLIGSSAIVNMLSNISLVIFTKFTFFREKKNPFYVLLSVLTLLKLLDVILKLYIPFSIPLDFALSPIEIPYFYIYLILTSLSILLSYPWLSFASLSYYKSIKNEAIEPWVKRRYQLIGYSSFIISINSVLYLLFPIDTYSWEQPIPFIIGLTITINTAIFSIANLIAWAMPERLKRFFNRNYEGVYEDELPEDQVMTKIKEELSKEE